MFDSTDQQSLSDCNYNIDNLQMSQRQREAEKVQEIITGIKKMIALSESLKIKHPTSWQTPIGIVFFRNGQPYIEPENQTNIDNKQIVVRNQEDDQCDEIKPKNMKSQYQKIEAKNQELPSSKFQDQEKITEQQILVEKSNEKNKLQESSSKQENEEKIDPQKKIIDRKVKQLQQNEQRQRLRIQNNAIEIQMTASLDELIQRHESNDQNQRYFIGLVQQQQKNERVMKKKRKYSKEVGSIEIQRTPILDKLIQKHEKYDQQYQVILKQDLQKKRKIRKRSEQILNERYKRKKVGSIEHQMTPCSNELTQQHESHHKYHMESNYKQRQALLQREKAQKKFFKDRLCEKIKTKQQKLREQKAKEQQQSAINQAQENTSLNLSPQSKPQLQQAQMLLHRQTENLQLSPINQASENTSLSPSPQPKTQMQVQAISNVVPKHN